ncbi:MAG: nucleotidyltransferase family protein [Tissierellaceae bacterium]
MKIEAIILAAGHSSRFGSNKLILEIEGLTVIERCLLSMYDYCSRIIVVGGHRIEDLYEPLREYPKVDLIYNKDYHLGMFVSVKCGLRALKGDKFFLTPGDYPMIDKSTFGYMLEVSEDIVLPSYRGKNGHPVLLKSHLINEILANESLNSLRDFIKIKGSANLEVADPGILLDIDTLEDYEKITQ